MLTYKFTYINMYRNISQIHNYSFIHLFLDMYFYVLFLYCCWPFRNRIALFHSPQSHKQPNIFFTEVMTHELFLWYWHFNLFSLFGPLWQVLGALQLLNKELGFGYLFVCLFLNTSQRMIHSFLSSLTQLNIKTNWILIWIYLI